MCCVSPGQVTAGRLWSTLRVLLSGKQSNLLMLPVPLRLYSARNCETNVGIMIHSRGDKCMFGHISITVPLCRTTTISKMPLRMQLDCLSKLHHHRLFLSQTSNTFCMLPFLNACSFFNPQPDPNSRPDCELVKACEKLPRDCGLFRQCNSWPAAGATACVDWKKNKCLYEPTVECLLLRRCFDATNIDDCKAYKNGNCQFKYTGKCT